MTVNPVLRRELLERWRGRRAFLAITVYAALLGFVLQMLYVAGSNQLTDALRFNRFGGGAPNGGPLLGRFLFENTLALVLLLVLFIGPGYAASQISGERERKTLGLLQITMLSPSSLVAGKLAASIAWLMLLILAAVPFGAAGFFLGGIALGDLLRALALVIVVAVSIASIALMISSLTRKTVTAVVATYAVVAMLTLGTLFTSLLEYTVLDRVDQGETAATMYANPFLGLTDAVRTPSAFRGFGYELPSVLSPFTEALPRDNRGFFGGGFDRPAVEFGFEGDGFAFEEEVFLGGGGVFLGAQDDVFAGPAREPVWLVTLLLYVLFGALAFVVATRRVAIPAPRTSSRRDTAPPVATFPAAPAPPHDGGTTA